MDDILWPVLSLGVAVIALIAAASTGSLMVIGMALATVAVAMAVIYQYTSSPKFREEEIPLEDFSWWADVGEPAASLKNLTGESPLVAQIISTDLKNIARNADLLSKRIALLVGRRDFDGISKEDHAGNASKIADTLSEVVQVAERDGTIPPILYKSLEHHAAALDRTANRLFEFQKGKSEEIHIYVEPLRRASEKMSRDLRKAASNIFKFEKRTKAAG